MQCMLSNCFTDLDHFIEKCYAKTDPDWKSNQIRESPTKSSSSKDERPWMSVVFQSVFRDLDTFSKDMLCKEDTPARMYPNRT